MPYLNCEKLYHLLGTTRENFKLEEARKYRRSLMLAIHPDHCKFPYADLMSSMVNYAFDVLSDPQKK